MAASYPQDCRYADSHEYVRVEGDLVRVGITAFAVEQLGDIVFVELPEVGSSLSAGSSFGSVESVKAVEDVIAPISDTITTALNEGPWYWAPTGDPEKNALTWDNSLWGPLDSPNKVGDSVGAVSDTITATVVQVLTWDSGYWDVNPWG